MTVDDLINELSRLDGNAKVLGWDFEDSEEIEPTVYIQQVANIRSDDRNDVFYLAENTIQEIENDDASIYVIIY